MSKTKHGFNCLKGPRGSLRKVKKIASGKMRTKGKSLCDRAMRGEEVSPIDFPVKEESLDKWALW